MVTGSEILDLPMSYNDARATTVRAYLIALLGEIWSKGEAREIARRTLLAIGHKPEPHS